MEYMIKILIKFIGVTLGYIIGTILWKVILKIKNKKEEKGQIYERRKIRGVEKYVENISLEEVFEILTNAILNKTDYPTFLYKRENEFVEITSIDLLQSRFTTEDDDFSEYEWEIEKSNIYILEEE